MTLKKSYWGSTGRFQIFADRVLKLIPSSGSVIAPKKNKSLEKLRKAVNCYYDLYNNGLGNRARDFKGVFGFSAGPYKNMSGDYAPRLYELLETRMDDIVLAAYAEQFPGNMKKN